MPCAKITYYNKWILLSLIEKPVSGDYSAWQVE
jgi:hypothetical protein